jgi:hypothetical protein
VATSAKNAQSTTGTSRLGREKFHVAYAAFHFSEVDSVKPSRATLQHQPPTLTVIR